MFKRLEQASLLADLASVEALLASRSAEVDPLGWFQFSRRKENLEKQISELDRADPGGGIAMFFGGKPVAGSHGIAADFGAAMMGQMQSLVSVRSASLEGFVGERGRVPQRDKSQMFITDVARGSFGFILESGANSAKTTNIAMEDVCDLLSRLGSSETERFDKATEVLDNRMLSVLQSFFKTLDENDATLRLVSAVDEFEFSREAIERARERTETLRVSEPYSETMTGRIYTMPDAKRFELFPLGGGPVIRGAISPAFINEMFDSDFIASREFIGKVMQVTLQVRETRLRSEAVRKTYQLVNVDDRDEPPEMEAW